MAKTTKAAARKVIKPTKAAKAAVLELAKAHQERAASKATNPAAAGIAAVKADDAEREALRTGGKPLPKALTGARGRVAAAKAAKQAKANTKAPAAKAGAAKPAQAEVPKYRGIWADAAEAAAKGKLPKAPDFSAETHRPYRNRLEKLIELAKAGDLRGLETVEMVPPRSTSPKALHRYRDLCVMALKAQRAKAA